MELTVISLAISAIEGLLPVVGPMLPAGVQSVVTFLENIAPQIAQLAPEVLQSIENIIASVTGAGNPTAAQVASLATTSAALNAALDAQAAKDGLQVGS